MFCTPSFFAQTTATQLAEKNTAADGEWTYKAEPVQGNKANLYQVVIYDQDGQKIGTL